MVTDISGHTRNYSLEDGTDMLFRNFGKYLPTYAEELFKRAKVPSTPPWKPKIWHRLAIAACLQHGHNLLSLQGILSYTLPRRLLCMVVTAIVIHGLIFKDATRCDYPAVSEHVTNYSAETGLMAGLCTLVVVDAVQSFGALKCNTDDMMRNVGAIRDSKQLMGAAVCLCCIFVQKRTCTRFGVRTVGSLLDCLIVKVNALRYSETSGSARDPA
jgi:hypothetical protein